jgi:membrane protein YqaA with SNARE-associated domain
MRMDFYLLTLTEALLNTLSPLFTEVTGPAMRAFGGYDLSFAAALGTLGGIIAALILWGIGRTLYYAGQHPRIAFKPERYERLHRDMHRYGIWLLLLTWLPVGFFIAIAAGFFNVRLSVAMPLIIVGMAVHYGLAFVG